MKTIPFISNPDADSARAEREGRFADEEYQDDWVDYGNHSGELDNKTLATSALPNFDIESFNWFAGNTEGSRVPIRILRTLYMKEYHIDYWTWRKQPWNVVIQNFRVLEAKNKAESEQQRKHSRLTSLREGGLKPQ